MQKKLAVLALAFASTMAFSQQNVPGTQDYKVNQSGAQKITNGPVVEYTSDHSAMIAWSTKFPGGSYVAYGADPNNLTQHSQEEWGGTNHRLELQNLQPSTTYYFQVRSANAKGSGAQGADVESNVASFQTVAKGAGPERANRNVGVNGGTAAPETGMPANSTAGLQLEPLYRLIGNNDHFYTTNPQERASSQSAGYQQEGVAGYVSSTQASGTEPFYRMLRQSGNSVDHFYTANPSEHQSALGMGYHDEGIAGYIATSQLPGTVPLYRMLGPNGDHFYTTNPAEKQSAAQQYGYKDELVAGYVWSQPQ